MKASEALPFVLTCYYCDDGEDLPNELQAKAMGWTEIVDDPDGLSWNQIGLCPECRREDLHTTKRSFG